MVGTYASEMEANLIVQRLAGAGIQATVRSDTIGGTFPSMEFATGGIEVLVPEESLPTAQRELGRAGPSPASRDGSVAQQPPTERGRHVRRTVTIGIVLLLIVIVLAAMLSYVD